MAVFISNECDKCGKHPMGSRCPYECERISKMSEWISVKDKFPPDDLPVLIHDKHGLYVAQRYKGSWGINCHCRDGSGDDGCTHWMPLPEPPN